MYIFLFPRVKGICDRSKEHQLNELSYSTMTERC